MKCIKTEDAVGHVLCHDMTQIIPGVSKGPRFRKGHIVTAEDIPVLLSMGKEQLYVWELQPGFLHENDAAERLCALCQNANMRKSETKEGKIELSSDIDGVFLVDTERLNAVNSIDEIMIATRRGNGIVHPGDKLCGTRVIPLIIEEEKLRQAEQAAGGTPILEVRPLTLKTAAVVTTGSEVAKGRIPDSFTPVVTKAGCTRHQNDRARSGRGRHRERGGGHRADEKQAGRYDPVHGRHERRSGRFHAGCDQTERRGYRHLRCAGAPGRHVLVGLLRGRPSGDGSARMRHVRQGHHF